MKKYRGAVKGGNEGVIGLEERKDEALPVSKRVQCVQCVYNVYNVHIHTVRTMCTYSNCLNRV